MNVVISLIVLYRASFDCSNAPISGMPYTSNTWAWYMGERRGIDTSCWNMPPYLRYSSAYHSPKCPLQIPCCAQCVTGRYGYLRNSEQFFTFYTTKENIILICNLSGLGLSTNPINEEDSVNTLPSFLQHLPQVCQMGHTIA